MQLACYRHWLPDDKLMEDIHERVNKWLASHVKHGDTVTKNDTQISTRDTFCVSGYLIY